MKLLLLLSLATLACSSKLYINRPVYIFDIFRDKTLADDFKDIKSLIPEKRIEGLSIRYLLGDSQFQGIVKYLQSQEMTIAIGQIKSQPEIKDFALWLRHQLQNGRLRDLNDSQDSEELHHILHHLAGPSLARLSGWTGFMTELLAIIPQQELKNLIRDKVAANGVFTDFWNKMIALKPVYERILKLPEMVIVVDKLRALGMDVDQLDRLIREDLGWKRQAIDANLNGALLENKFEGNEVDAVVAPVVPVV